MITTPITPTRVFRIEDIMGDPHRLDPVTVIMLDHEPGRGTLIVQCFDQAWTCYWGAMGGGASLAEFMLRVDAGYIADNLVRGIGGRMTRRAADMQQKYVTRIAAAIRDALRAGVAA